MRLYDQLFAARGGMFDRVTDNSLTTFCRLLERAQCFLISDTIAETCTQLCRSKPSSILSAIDMTRTPYPFTWIEWSPADRTSQVDNGKPMPDRVGALLMTNAAGSKGQMALAWVHKGEHGITLNPLSLIFNWDSKSTEPVIQQYAASMGINESHIADRVAERKRQELQKRQPIGRWAHHRSPEERAAILELEMRAEMVPLEFCTPFMLRYGMVPGDKVFEDYSNDLNGELPFIEAFLLLLNSRNTIVEQRRDDFSRLNKARAKARKPPLKEFINTGIKLNRVQSNRSGMTAAERAAAHGHMVRGHFKLKFGKLWWWSAHPRGASPGRPRSSYEVR